MILVIVSICLYFSLTDNDFRYSKPVQKVGYGSELYQNHSCFHT